MSVHLTYRRAPYTEACTSHIGVHLIHRRAPLSHARHVIGGDTKKIRQQMRSKRGRPARVRKTLGQRKEQWMYQIGKTKAYELEDREERPPWAAQDTPEQHRINAAHKSYV